MTRYIAIDNYTGYVWADSATLKPDDDSIVAFLQAMERDIDNRGKRDFERATIRDTTASGYHVYRVLTRNFPIVRDGQDAKTIERVKAKCQFAGSWRAVESDE